MRKFSLRFMVAAGGLLLMTSCGQDDAAISLSAEDVDTRARNPSVSGHVELDSLDDNGRNQRYSFTAVMQKDGSVRGEFQLFDLLDDTTKIVIHGNVECFTIQDDGKTAWLGGVVERGMLNTTDLEGTEAYWTVVDNGQGANVSPDEATEIVYEGVLAQDHCSEGLGTFIHFGPIVRGNVRVKP